MKEVQDNFSAGAAGYAAFRPASPDEVFDFLYAHVRHFGTAWDCGTGNGQVAGRLADRFEQVIATDISSDQLKLAIQKDNISYRQERAEVTGIESASIDLITVAQAIHWFDFEHFYAEVRRVARPGALCAAWTYNLLKLTPEVNSVIDDFYHGTTRKYWDKERDLVDAGYSTIPFPFREIVAPPITITRQWNVEQLVGYIRTWSGVQHFIKKEQQDPTVQLAHQLRQVWGETELLEVRWPVFVRAGIVE